MDERRRKLLFRANHRGFKEMDLLMGAFAQQTLAGMSSEELDEFEHLLALDDQDVYGWIIGREPAPEHVECAVLEQLKAFDLPKYLSRHGLA